MINCSGCGKGYQIAICGEQNTVYTCPQCQCLHYGRPDKGQCGKCQNLFGNNWARRQMADYEPIVAGRCPACVKALRELHAAEQAGALIFCCDECGTVGAFAAEAEITANFRKDHPVGRLRFEKCQQHGGLLLSLEPPATAPETEAP